MLGRMHRSFFTEDLLRAGNRMIIDPRAFVMGEACARACRRANGHPHTSTFRRAGSGTGRGDSGNIADGVGSSRSDTSGLPSNTGSETRFDSDSDLKIGPALLEDGERRCGQYAVAERA